jgi:hypothetical protein
MKSILLFLVFGMFFAAIPMTATAEMAPSGQKTVQPATLVQATAMKACYLKAAGATQFSCAISGIGGAPLTQVQCTYLGGLAECCMPTGGYNLPGVRACITQNTNGTWYRSR